jgi:hypothetical protein
MPDRKRPDLAGAEIQDLTPLGDQLDLEPEALEDVDVQEFIKRAVEEAVMHFEEHIEPDMAMATDYYYGRPFGDEKAGRSQVVSTDVRDSTLDQIPDLLEIFMGSDSVVEFKPRKAEDRPVAEQATDYVNYVFFEDNDGFLILNSVFKDAGVRRLGYVKWWWEEQERVTGSEMTGVTEEELMFLSEQEGIDFEVIGQRDDMVMAPNPQTQQMEAQVTVVYDIEVTKTGMEGKVRVEEVPPEEIVWSPEARKFSRAPIIAHTREVPRDELLMLGIPEEFIDEHKGVRGDRSTESLAWSRQFYGSSSISEIVRDGRDKIHSDPSQEPVTFTEVYAWVDTDDDDIAELRMFQCVGPDYEIVPDDDGEKYGELVDEIPLAVFTPDPEPHTIPGLCNFDYLKEIQRVKSQIQRGQLNSLAQSIENQLVVASSEVNMRDLISPEISGIIRVRRDTSNSIREIRHQFVGGDTLPVLEYYDQIMANRTGRAGPREGLDPNVLQSTTPEAVASTLSKGQQRIKMLARVYAETGFKHLFKGIYGLLVKHQDRERVVRLRNEYVQVDPRYWNAEMDVRVNVALGTGSRSEKIAGLQALVASQESHLQMGSPLVSFAELRNTYGKLTDLLGYKDTSQFWKQWGPEQQQAFEQQQAEAAQNQPDDPATMVAKVEELKVQLQAQEAQQKMELERYKVELQDARERDKAAREFALKEYEIELKYQSEIDDRALQAKIAKAKAGS